MNATAAPATGAFVTAMLGYEPQQRVTFDYAGHTLVVTRGVPHDEKLPGVEFAVVELDAEGHPCEWLFVLGAQCPYARGEREFTVQTMFQEVLAETTTLEAALGATLAHFQR